MKKLNLLILVLCLLYLGHLSAANTFGKKLEGMNISFSVSPTSDGGMITSGLSLNSDSTIIIKTDKNGNETWRKYFAGYGYHHDSFSDIKQSEDEGYIFSNSIELDDAAISAYKLDSAGEIIWHKIYDNQGDDFSREVLVTTDNGYLFLYRNEAISCLVKTDSIGNEQWVVKDTLSGSVRYDLQVRQTKDDGYIFCRKGSFIKYDRDGKIEWKQNNYSILRTKVEELYLGGYIAFRYGMRILERTNSLGKTLWQRELSAWSRDFTIDKNDNIIVAGSKLIKLDTLGNIIWQKNLFLGEISDIDVEKDGSIILTGRIGYSDGFIARYNASGEAKFIILYRPQNGEHIENDTKYDIRWASSGLGKINIDWQNENHPTWETLAQLQDTLLIYQWLTPVKRSLQNKIRISSASDPNIFDEILTGFSIGAKHYDYIAINEIFMYFGTDGGGSYDQINAGSGLFWPGGFNGTQAAVFSDGPLWGGLVNGDTLVHGSTYRQGLQPGNILSNGIAADPNSPDVGVYKVRPDWQLLPDSPLRERLEYDWNHWPVHLGAPWVDEDGDGNYNPQIDQPEISGDEMNWMVMNDLDSVKTKRLYGAYPIGIEVQLAIYGFNTTNDLKDVIFKRYKLLNKSDYTVDSMYFSYWADVDLGDAGDDYVGTDTVLNMVYSFNGDEDDGIYQGVPPAIGYVLLQGPVVPAETSDSAFVFNQWQFGYKNKRMTSSVLYIGGDPIFSDPYLGSIEGSQQMWNYMRGWLEDGSRITNPVTGSFTNFIVPGDPVNGTGWYEGLEEGAWGRRSGDRRQVLSSGPVTFAPGDSQEVVYAIVIARGDNRLDSVTKLKEKAAAVREFYYTGKLPTAINDEEPVLSPNKFSLSQNYPNPFNPSTIINYELRIMNEVKLVVYDVLGREVKTLVNKTQSAGKYKVTFDATGFASGVYYYKLKAGKDFELTRKMLLLR
jgi:Secretion system C-terminal sorting domain